MSSDKANVCDEHKHPFSLVSEFKHGHNRDIVKVGDVTELMDKAIGRLVFRIKGAVSATNYVEFDRLNLIGPILYIQMCLVKPSIATIHLEVKTTSNIPLRLTLSTLYNGDQPRFLGRSLRLPLPAVPGWMVLAVDLNQILDTYCQSGSIPGKGPELQLRTLQKIQLCSNMLLRDIVTSDKEIPLETKYLPKELSVKPLPASQGLEFVDLMEFCASIPSTASAGNSPNTGLAKPVSERLAALGIQPRPTTAATAKTAAHNATNNNKSVPSGAALDASEGFHLNHELLHQAFPPPSPMPPAPHHTAAASQLEAQTPLASMPLPPQASSARRTTPKPAAKLAQAKASSTAPMSSKVTPKRSSSLPRGTVTLKDMNLPTTSTLTLSTASAASITEEASSPVPSAAVGQLVSMFEELSAEQASFSVQNANRSDNNANKGPLRTPAPVPAAGNGNSKYGECLSGLIIQLP